MRKTSRLLIVFFLSLSLFLGVTDIVQAKGKGSYRGYRSSSYRGNKSYKIGGFKSYKIKYTSLNTYKTKSSLSKSKIYVPKSSKKYSAANFSNKPKRSAAKKKEFLKSRGYDKNPSGQEVDHIIPLSEGGADEPYNMQLLPKEVHKQKTKTEQSGNKGYLFRK